jgi:hypothetical protein
MTDYYMDTDGGSDASNGTTWALAKLTLEGLLAVMSAGDRCFIQGSATDTAATSRTFTSPGTITNPCILIGVVDGTTNEPPVLSDLAVTLPKIECTGGASDITLAGYHSWINLHLSSSDKFIGIGAGIKITNGKLSLTDDTNVSFITLENTILETLQASGSFATSEVLMTGGSLISTVSASVVDISGYRKKVFIGVDFSAISTTAFINTDGAQNEVILKNCKLPSVFNKFGSSPIYGATITVIASSDTSSQASDSSIQDYEYEDVHGTIDLELTAVRTGGADDGASGAFAYAMTPSASSTLESSSAELKSPWMTVWIPSGSQTLTVYIANDSASTDYNEDEVWCEFYTPDASDTAQHDQNFDPAGARLFPSSTIVTDDTGSTWGTGANNHQKMEVSVTPGFEGWAYARLHLTKRQATPDTLFLDPKIGVS